MAGGGRIARVAVFAPNNSEIAVPPVGLEELSEVENSILRSMKYCNAAIMASMGVLQYEGRHSPAKFWKLSILIIPWTLLASLICDVKLNMQGHSLHIDKQQIQGCPKRSNSLLCMGTVCVCISE